MGISALEGIKVLDVSTMIAAPFGAVLLADFGAEVIKIEMPGKGDTLRSVGPFYKNEPLRWPGLSRNKKSLTLDLHKPEGVEIFKKLAAKVDILIENFRPGTLEKWGAGHRAASQHRGRHSGAANHYVHSPYTDALIACDRSRGGCEPPRFYFISVTERWADATIDKPESDRPIPRGGGCSMLFKSLDLIVIFGKDGSEIAAAASMTLSSRLANTLHRSRSSNGTSSGQSITTSNDTPFRCTATIISRRRCTCRRPKPRHWRRGSRPKWHSASGVIARRA